MKRNTIHNTTTAARGGLIFRTLAPLLAVGVLLSALSPTILAQEEKCKAVQIQGEFNLNELKRLLEIAEESGFTDKQIQEITVEDEEGNCIPAYKFIKAEEERKRKEADRIAAERKRVYLTPHDIITELDEKQHRDIEKLREEMFFVE